MSVRVTAYTHPEKSSTYLNKKIFIKKKSPTMVQIDMQT